MNVSDKATYKAGSLQYLPQFFSPNAVKIVRWRQRPAGDGGWRLGGDAYATSVPLAKVNHKGVPPAQRDFYIIFEKVIRPYSLTHEEVPFPTPVLHHFYTPDHYITILLRSIPQNTGKKHLIARGIGTQTACPQARVEGPRTQTV